jgi:hypothetical protein
MRISYWLMVLLLSANSAMGGQGHVVEMGSWTSIKLASGEQVKIRPIVVDGRIKEYTLGTLHRVTKDLFVVRRAVRMNEALPGESAKGPQWSWQLDGWISVNDSTAHIAELKLPEFDSRTSDVSWYRDYAAYCGRTPDGSARHMIIFQLGQRKPVLKKELYGESCAAPEWDRNPSRVTFNPSGGPKVSFIVHDSIAELVRP